MNPNGYIGRKTKLPDLKKKPAVILTAFGSSGSPSDTNQRLEQRLSESLADHEFFWAYTSDILRKKNNLPGLQETLAKVEASGYRKAIVQPLHIFPGLEYQQILETCHFFPGLRVIVGETLCHRWDNICKLIDILQNDFLPTNEGLNLLAVHGSPIASAPVNISNIGIADLVKDRYPNVITTSLEGIPNADAVFKRIEREQLANKWPRIKIIPMMFQAGHHVKKDLMGNENSWKVKLEKMGFIVEISTIKLKNKTNYKALNHYPQCATFFHNRITTALALLDIY